MIMQDTTFAFAGDCSLISISLFHFSVFVLFIYFFLFIESSLYFGDCV